jgi:hypothetical protein
MHQAVMGEPPEPRLELGHVTATGFTIGAVTCGGFAMRGTIQASHDRLPYVCRFVGHLESGSYARDGGIFTTDALAGGSPRMRFPSVWSERKLNKNCKTAKPFQTFQIGFFNDFKWLGD